LITWPGDQYQGHHTPDGQALVFLSNWDPEEGLLPGYLDYKYSFYVMDGNSATPRRLRAADHLYDPWEVRISPDGQTLAFDAQIGPDSDDDVYTMGIDGTNLRRLTDTPEDEGSVAWSLDGSRISFTRRSGAIREIHSMAVDGTDRRLVTGPGGGPAVRRPSGAISPDNIRAARFRPVLRFDTSERWRPLHVGAFFSEAQHTLCDDQGCEAEPMTSPGDLRRRANASAYIDVAGFFSDPGGEANYTSPNPECTSGGLRDCDTGSASAFYYRLADPTFGGYRYIDYWIFYRVNYFLEEMNFHEGDWEGVTVAPSPDGVTFDYAAFSQHGTFYAYLRDVLRCEDSPSSDVPPAGSCGTEDARSGQRVAVMPSNGGHSNYTTPCSETLLPLGSCRQNGFYELERGYDGAVRWGRAFDDPASTLFEMPARTDADWPDWPGSWGAPHSLPATNGPASPGIQDVNITCATHDNGPDCNPGPRAAASATQAEAGVGSPGLTALSCRGWIGAGIATAVCDPRRLRRAVLHRQLGRRGTNAVSVASRRATSASAPGITQLSTRRPLVNGSRVRIRGPLSAKTRILVRARDRSAKRAIIAEFRVAARQPALIATSRRRPTKLRLLIRGRSSERPRVSLGGTRANYLRVVRLRRR
jgi:hypothetical protein